MTKLARTRGTFLKEVLQELEEEILEPLAGFPEWSAGFKKGYLKALEDVYERMGK